MNEFKLSDVDRTAGCITCKHVMEENKPVLMVSTAGGRWIMICGSPEHLRDEREDENYEEELIVAHMYHIFEKDNSLLDILDLPDDVFAERDGIGMPWRLSEDKE